MGNATAKQYDWKQDPRPCEWCGQEYQPIARAKNKPPQQFCSKSCVAAASNTRCNQGRRVSR